MGRVHVGFVAETGALVVGATSQTEADMAAIGEELGVAASPDAFVDTYEATSGYTTVGVQSWAGAVGENVALRHAKRIAERLGLKLFRGKRPGAPSNEINLVFAQPGVSAPPGYSGVRALV